jgi:hypothetical protein
MQKTKLTAVEQRLTPEIWCEPLPSFDPSNLASVRHAFQSATPCFFRQAWLDKEETGFSPGVVRTAGQGNLLLVFAELTDVDIFSWATKLNQRAWELGDVLEIFLRPAETESYFEFHVTPNNQRLQLAYPDVYGVAKARSTGRLDEFLIPGDVLQSRTWIEKPLSKWYVYAEIPVSTVTGSCYVRDQMQWRFSFGRYDYTRGTHHPVISSTSPLTQPDFHRQHEWGVMNFKNPPVGQR